MEILENIENSTTFGQIRTKSEIENDEKPCSWEVNQDSVPNGSSIREEHNIILIISYNLIYIVFISFSSDNHV